MGKSGYCREQPVRDEPRACRAYEPPRNKIESAVAAIWQDTLGIERVSRSDNFFSLGGESLSGTGVLWRLAEVLQASPPLVSIFGYATVREMAALAERMLAQDMEPPPLARSGRERGIL